MGVKFANLSLELGLKYHDPPHLTELKEKCSRFVNVPGANVPVFQANKKKKGNKNKIKGKQKKLRQKNGSKLQKSYSNHFTSARVA